MRTPITPLAVALLCGGLIAQTPLLRLQPTGRPGQPLQTLLVGAPAQPFATFLDLAGGPVTVLGETLWLALSPALTQIDAGQLDGIGARASSLPTPSLAALVGQPFFMQSVVLDPQAANGLFAASNGQSTILHGHTAAIVFEFRDAFAEGVTGTYDPGVKERLMAGPIARRTHTVAPASGLPFPQAVQTPLSPPTARMQHVYRAGDLGASGEPEYVTALRWRPLGPVTPDAFARVHITLGHTTIVPDYTIDLFSALPKYPSSGLGMTFAGNYKAQDTPVVVCDAPYSIVPSALRADGFMPWPALSAAFLYNGIDSLLVDERVVASATTAGTNGFAVRLMVLSAAQPNTRVFAPGNMQPSIDPFAVQTAAQGDNTLYELQLDFVRATSTATTRFVQSPGPMKRYFAPAVAASVPAGTRYELWFEGATDQSGTNATGFVSDVAWLATYGWLRMQVRFTANPLDGARPSLDTVVIPVD